MNLDVAELQANLAGAIETAQTEAVVVERDGQPVAVVISPVRFDYLMEVLEDREDIEAVDASLAEGGEPIPLDELKQELGW